MKGQGQNKRGVLAQIIINKVQDVLAQITIEKKSMKGQGQKLGVGRHKLQLT